MTTTSRKLRIGETGDVHLGHHNTLTSHVLKALYKAFPDNAETGDLDMIIIAGDLYDRLVMHSEVVLIDQIRRWFFWFLSMCKRRDIVVRILEGTPSHDWKQSANVISENEIAAIGADVKWVDTLSIEYIERFGINILYVPDEWRVETDDVWKDVVQALTEKGLEKVDFTILHGAFNYQLPSHVPVPTHIPERYMGITRYFVFGGHIHKRSQYGNILAAGSLERLSHGEEEDKGHYRVVVDREHGNHEIKFVVNEDAMLYKTIDLKGCELEDCMNRIQAMADTMPIGTFIRVLGNKGDPIQLGFKEVEKHFNLHSLSGKWTDGEKITREAVNRIVTPFTPVAITPTSVVPMVLERLKRRGFSPEQLALAEEYMNGSLLPSTG